MINLKNPRLNIIAATLLAILILISWAGTIDKISLNYINESLVNATLAFAAARAINAIISVLQSTNISLFFLSISPGEILDPINDLVEQFSTLMKYAIGSLLLQKFLLQIVSDAVFKTLLTITGLAIGLCALLKIKKGVEILYRPFLFIIFLRFVIVLSVLANGIADRVFLDKDVEQNLAALESYPSRIESLNPEDAITPETRMALENDLEKIAAAIQQETNIIDEAVIQKGAHLAEIEQLQTARDKIHETLGMLQRFNPLNENEQLDTINQKIAEHRTAINQQQKIIDQSQKNLDQYLAEQAIIESTLSGESGGILQSITNSVRKLGSNIMSGGLIASFKSMMDSMVATVSEVIPVMMNLIALFILQTVVLPLLFLYAVIQGFKAIWGMDPRTAMNKIWQDIKIEKTPASQ